MSLSKDLHTTCAILTATCKLHHFKDTARGTPMQLSQPASTSIVNSQIEGNGLPKREAWSVSGQGCDRGQQNAEICMQSLAGGRLTDGRSVALRRGLCL